MFAGEKCFWLTRVIKKSVQTEFDPATRYVGAVTISVLGLLFAVYLRSVTGMGGVPVTLLTTVVAATFGGLGPGIVAAVVSGVGVDIFLVSEPYQATSMNLGGIVRLAVLVAISCLVGLLVSFLRMALESAERAREASELANKEKDAVIAFLSHDLRGPLSSISLTFQLVQRLAKMEGKQDEIHRLSSNGVFFCHRMAHLIQNLLDASKIKSGGITLSPALHDLRSVVSKIFDEHRLLADEKKIHFGMRVHSEGSYSVNCDQVLVAQVLANLILNSFKFTPSGGEVILDLDTTDDFVQIKITDNGQGIPASQLENVFEKFWHGKTRVGEGTGLGLFISRAIVEAHRGEISVESTLNKGSCFTIKLPKNHLTSGETGSQVSLSRVLQSA
jgi:signal transduction histidine kinase